MAIAFARARYLSRSKGDNAVRSAAYNSRSILEAERTGERYRYQDHGTLAHHEVVLPDGVPARWADPAVLWNAVEFAERRKDSVVAREIVIALPADLIIIHHDRVELVRSFVRENFTSKGLAVQIDIHRPAAATTQSETANYHAHLLITTRRIDGNQLSSRKALDLDPQVRSVGRKRVVATGDEWGAVWRDHQNSYFGTHGKALSVDSVAPFPAEHLGPQRFRHPRDPRISDAVIIKELNAAVARDPRASLDHLEKSQQQFDGRALARFLAKHLPTDEHAGIHEKLVALKRLALEDAQHADKVPSRWRQLTVEDLARELSSEYAKRLKEISTLKSTVRKAQWIRDQRASDISEADIRLASRAEKLGLFRRLLHRADIWRDRETDDILEVRRKAQRGHERWAIRSVAFSARLRSVERLAAEALERIRPEAQRELERRQKIAQNARGALATINEGVILKADKVYKSGLSL